MRKRSGVVLVLGAFALATVSLAASVDLWLYRVPDPQAADRDGLFRWLVLRDLAQEPLATRQALIARFEEEFEAGLQLAEATGKADEKYRIRLEQNIDRLVTDWFRLQAAAFHAAPYAQRPALLDAQIDKIERWGLVDLLLPPGNAPGKPKSHAQRLLEFDRWAQSRIAQSEDDEQPPLRQYFTALEAQLVARHLRQLW